MVVNAGGNTGKSRIMNTRSAEVIKLYDVFARYSFPGESFCTFCYSPEEIEHITRTPLAELDQQTSRVLLWEASDHWESSEVYRHYLPRVLEILGPPWFEDDMYTSHLFETLHGLDFHAWPHPEREAVVEYLESITPVMTAEMDPDEALDWSAGVAGLRSLVPSHDAQHTDTLEFPGGFETHLTVQLCDETSLAALREWGERHGMKCLHIVLSRGATLSQPMLTVHSLGTLTGELARIRALASRLDDAGFVVSRVKLEVEHDNPDVPASDAAAQEGSAGARYFEHHIKLLLPETADIDALTELSVKHGAHLSRNALREREDGCSERFVTQRFEGVGRDTSAAGAAALVHALRESGYEIITHQGEDAESEYVVFDSNISLDAGWLPDAPR